MIRVSVWGVVLGLLLVGGLAWAASAPITFATLTLPAKDVNGVSEVGRLDSLIVWARLDGRRDSFRLARYSAAGYAGRRVTLMLHPPIGTVRAWVVTKNAGGLQWSAKSNVVKWVVR
jgi:hypothetical protein